MSDATNQKVPTTLIFALRSKFYQRFYKYSTAHFRKLKRISFAFAWILFVGKFSRTIMYVTVDIVNSLQESVLRGMKNK